MTGRCKNQIAREMSCQLDLPHLVRTVDDRLFRNYQLDGQVFQMYQCECDNLLLFLRQNGCVICELHFFVSNQVILLSTVYANFAIIGASPHFLLTPQCIAWPCRRVEV